MMDPMNPLPEGALAVIFISRMRQHVTGYAVMAERMVELAATQDGFLSFVSSRAEEGIGITVSFWRDRQAALAWKEVAEHLQAQRLGSERWYSRWSLHICTIDESRAFAGEDTEPE